LLASGCTASVQANVEASGDVDVHDFDKPLSADQRDRVARLGEGAEPGASASTALFGARHDLRLTAGAAGSPKCRCLAAALGTAHAPGFAWQAEVPSIDPRTQLVIALGSDGLSCGEEPADSLGASYWGYKVSGNDVIVVVEAARAGRPVTRGAIIPKPVAPGQVYVQPLTASTPYGAALSGTAARCALGNPG
jgi:hypothetical protein